MAPGKRSDAAASPEATMSPNEGDGLSQKQQQPKQSQYHVDMAKRQFPKPAVFWSAQEKTAFSLNRMEQARLDVALGHMSMHRRTTLRDLQSSMIGYARRRHEYDRLRAALSGVLGEASRSQLELHQLSSSVETRLNAPRGVGGSGGNSSSGTGSGGGGGGGGTATGYRSATDIVDVAEISRLFGFRVERCLRTSTSLQRSRAGRQQQQQQKHSSQPQQQDPGAEAGRGRLSSGSSGGQARKGAAAYGRLAPPRTAP